MSFGLNVFQQLIWLVGWIIVAAVVECVVVFRTRHWNHWLTCLAGAIFAGRLYVIWFVSVTPLEKYYEPSLGSEFTGWFLWSAVTLFLTFSILSERRIEQDRKRLRPMLYASRLVPLFALVILAANTIILPIYSLAGMRLASFDPQRIIVTIEPLKETD